MFYVPVIFIMSLLTFCSSEEAKSTKKVCLDYPFFLIYVCTIQIDYGISGV